MVRIRDYAPHDLVFIEYRLIIDRNFMKIGAISLLILASAVENGL
jgi:hypothetical protein